MIKKIRKNPPKKKSISYGKYFLTYEAPGDEEENQEEIQQPEVEDVPLLEDDEDTNFNQTDEDIPDVTEPDPIEDSNFNEIDDSPPIEDNTSTSGEELPEEIDTTNTEPEQTDGTDTNPEEETIPNQTTNVDATDTVQPVEDTTTGGEEENTSPTEQNVPTDVETPEQTTNTGTDTAQPVPAEETPVETPVENETTDNVETPPEDTTTGTEETPAGAEDTGTVEDDTDFNTMDDSGETTTTDATSSNTGTGEEGEKGPGLEYDSTRKYVLFKEYISLYNAINSYIQKLDSNISDDLETNKIISRASENLREIRDLTYDFMTMKFEISSYTQSLLFFQTLIVSVQMVFRIFENIDFYKKDE